MNNVRKITLIVNLLAIYILSFWVDNPAYTGEDPYQSEDTRYFGPVDCAEFAQTAGERGN